MYKALLVDLDNTLLDFNKAEERALTTTLLRYGLNDTKEIKEEFKKINSKYWMLFEKGEISINKLRSLEEMYEEYVEIFHGNGYVKTLMERVRKLPIVGKLDD